MLPALFSNGHASTMGLIRTSIRPLLTAYTITDSRIPQKGTGNKSGRNASITSPKVDKM